MRGFAGFFALSLSVALLLSAQASPATPAEDLLALGQRQMGEGDFEAAVESFTKAIPEIQKDPRRAADLPGAYLQLGIAQAQLGSDGPARQAFREALSLNPTLRLNPEEQPSRVVRLFEAERLARTAGAKEHAQKRGFLGGALVGAASMAAGYFATGGVVTQTVTTTRPNRPPTVSAIGVTPDGQAIAGVTTMHFNANAVDADGQALTYAWKFGDGATTSGITVQHVYTAAGTYTVALDVTDSGNLTSTVSTTVAVGTLTGTWQAGGSDQPQAQVVQDGTSLRISNYKDLADVQVRLRDPRTIDPFLGQYLGYPCDGKGGRVSSNLKEIDLYMEFALPGSFPQVLVLLR